MVNKMRKGSSKPQTYWEIGAFLSPRIHSGSWSRAIVGKLAEYIKRNQPELRGYGKSNLYNKDLAEGRNTGIGKIVRAMRENGSPDPEFFNSETRSFMTVILPIHEAFRAEIVEKVPNSTEKTGLKTVMKTVVKTESKSEKVVEYLKMYPFATRQDIARETELSVRGVEWNLRKLSQAGIIRRVGPDKDGHWEVIGNV